LLGGGVAANKLLRKKLQATSYKLQATFLAAEPKICTDNAAMIAFAGYLHTLKKVKSKKPAVADANWEIQ